MLLLSAYPAKQNREPQLRAAASDTSRVDQDDEQMLSVSPFDMGYRTVAHTSTRHTWSFELF